MQPGKLIIQKEVKSKTSNNIYNVFIFDNCVACTCPAGGKKQICKHIMSIVHKNLEIIEKESPKFLNKLMQAIEVKCNKNIPYDEKLKEYAKVVYINQEIIKTSIENINGIEKSDKKELELFKPIVENCRLYELYEFLNISRKSPYNIFFAKKCEELQKLKKIGFVKISPIKFGDYIRNIHYTKDFLTKKLKEHNIKIPDKSNKQYLLDLANKNKLFNEDMKHYCTIRATELFTTSKDIISYLHKNRSKYEENKKILDIRFLKEDTSIKV